MRQYPIHEPKPDEAGPAFSIGERRFRCLPVLPAGAVVQIPLSWPLGDEPPSDIYVAHAVLFIERCLPPDQRQAFNDALLDPERIVARSTVIEIARDLVAEFVPFERRAPASSPNGPRSHERTVRARLVRDGWSWRRAFDELDLADFLSYCYELIVEWTGLSRAQLDRQLEDASYPWGESPSAVAANDAFAAALGGDE